MQLLKPSRLAVAQGNELKIEYIPIYYISFNAEPTAFDKIIRVKLFYK
jgi:hypothetical protein